MQSNEKYFTNFKIHTQYSICEGAIKIDDLAEYCKTNKSKSIGICDSYNLCGALEFAEKISKVGTQPIIGSQINFLIDDVLGKMPVFAKTEKGYKNLVKLSSKSFLGTNEKTDPHCDIKSLEAFNDDLILLSGNHRDLLGKLFSLNKLKKIEELINNIKKIFKDRFYLEIQRHNEPGEEIFENYLTNLSSKFDLPLIASQEVYYRSQNMYEAHDALICIGEKTYIDDSKRFKFSNQHYLKENKDLINLFKDIPEALENNFQAQKIFTSFTNYKNRK